MPSEVFAGLRDQDLGRIIALLKTLPSVAGPDPRLELAPLGRLGRAAGRFKLAAQLIADAVPPPEAASEEGD